MISHDKKAGRKLIVTSAIEHPCVIEASKRLSDFGFEVIRLAVDKDGIVDIAEYKKFSKKPLLISIMAANNEIGTIQDIKTLAAMAHDVGALFHTDAVQAAGKSRLMQKTGTLII